MYRVSHEFTFEINQNNTPIKFLGQLIFQSSELNEVGSLHTEDDMANFGVALNRTIDLPEYWTLEILTKSLFDNIKPIFRNLKAINLTIEHAEHRVAEYSNDYEGINEIVELTNLVG